jgi:hypothetical protein
MFERKVRKTGEGLSCLYPTARSIVGGLPLSGRLTPRTPRLTKNPKIIDPSILICDATIWPSSAASSAGFL